MKDVLLVAKKAAYIVSWIPPLLFHTFPLLIFAPITDWSWGTYFLPIGALFLGLVAVPLAMIGRDDEMATHYGRYFASIWWLWDNKGEPGTNPVPGWWYKKAEAQVPDPEDKWYEKAQKYLIRTFPRWWWFAIRNPVNGFRWIFTDRDPEHVEFYGENFDPETGSMEPHELLENGVMSASRWAMSGMFAGYRRVWIDKDDLTRYGEFWVGWKVGSEVPGLGFTFQLRKGDVGN